MRENYEMFKGRFSNANLFVSKFCKMSRQRNYKPSDVDDLIRITDDFCKDWNNWYEALGVVLGVTWGYSTTFCPFKSRLDDFSNVVERRAMTHFSKSISLVLAS